MIHHLKTSTNPPHPQPIIHLKGSFNLLLIFIFVEDCNKIGQSSESKVNRLVSFTFESKQSQSLVATMQFNLSSTTRLVPQVLMRGKW
jgi:hypothetical protein